MDPICVYKDTLNSMWEAWCGTKVPAESVPMLEIEYLANPDYYRAEHVILCPDCWAAITRWVFDGQRRVEVKVQ